MFKRLMTTSMLLSFVRDKSRQAKIYCTINKIVSGESASFLNRGELVQKPYIVSMHILSVVVRYITEYWRKKG